MAATWSYVYDEYQIALGDYSADSTGHKGTRAERSGSRPHPDLVRHQSKVLAHWGPLNLCCHRRGCHGGSCRAKTLSGSRLAIKPRRCGSHRVSVQCCCRPDGMPLMHAARATRNGKHNSCVLVSWTLNSVGRQSCCCVMIIDGSMFCFLAVKNQSNNYLSRLGHRCQSCCGSDYCGSGQQAHRAHQQIDRKLHFSRLDGRAQAQC